MADEMEQDYFPDPIFFEKKSLTGNIRQELENSRNAFEDRRRKVKDIWQATVKVVKERHETNLVLNKSMLVLQNEEPGPSTSDDSRRKESIASRVVFGPEMGDEAVEFYKMWIREFKKNASKQREVVLYSVEKCFNFLHRFDEVEERPQPQQSVPEGPMITYLLYVSGLLLFMTCVLFIFQNYDLRQISEDLFVYLHEISITLAFKIWNFYLKLHDITIDYSNVSDNSYYISEMADDSLDN